MFSFYLIVFKCIRKGINMKRPLTDTNTTTSNKSDYFRSNSNVATSASVVNTTLGRRNIRTGGGGTNIVDLLFRYYDIGGQILKYLFTNLSSG